MAAFRATSRVQYDSLIQDGSPWFLARRDLVPLVRAVGRYFPHEEAGLSVRDAEKFGPALGFLSARQQEMLLRLLDRYPGDAQRSEVIAHLGPELAHLQGSQRRDLVTAALALANDGRVHEADRAYAIKGLAPSLAHLEPSLRGDLVRAALNLPNGDLKGGVIVGLAKSLSQLSVTERDALVEATLLLPDHERAVATAALGPGLPLLKEAQCNDLVRTAAADSIDGSIAMEGVFQGLAGLSADPREMIINNALAGLNVENCSLWAMDGALRPDVEYLNEPQRKKIIDAAVAALGDDFEDDFEDTIMGLGPAVAYFSKPQRDAIVRRAIRLSELDESTDALFWLGTSMAHLDEAQREALLRAARSLPENTEELATDKGVVFAGMAVGAARLGENPCKSLADEVMGLQNDLVRSAAIRGFGEGLEHLDSAQQQALINAATENDSVDGLTRGLRHLAQPERQLLLNAAERLEDAEERATAVIAIAKATSEALLLREQGARGP